MVEPTKTTEEKKTGKFYAKKLLSGSAAMMLSSASMKLVKLFVLPIMTYYLSPKDFGIIASIKMVQGVLILLYNPGIISGTSRLYYDTEDEKERKTLIGSSFLFFITFSLCVSIILLVTGDALFASIFKEFSFYPYGLVAVLLSIMIQPKRLWSALLTFQYKIKKIALLSVIQMLVDLAISLYLVTILIWEVEGRIIGIASGVAFIFIVSVVTIIKYADSNFSLKKAWKIFKFSIPLAPAIWAYSILDIADRFLIEHFIGLADLGIYSIAYILSSVPLFLSMGFRSMWNPIFYENMNNKKYEIINSLIKSFLVLNSIVCCFLILFSDEVVTYILAKDFGVAREIIPWVTLGVYFLGILPISTSFLTYQKKFKGTSLNAGISAIINILLNIWLLPKIGLVGSAIATFIAYLIYFMLNLLMVGKLYLQVSNFRVFILPSIFLMISMLLFFALDMSLYNSIIKLLVFIGFAIAILAFGYFTKNEISFLKKMVLNIGKKKNG